jgi:hypothetical protein
VERELGLEVGLVETGIHALGVVDLELAEEVDLAVGRVDGPVQSLARGRVREIGVDDQHVVGGQSGQGQAPFRRPPGNVHIVPVERRRVDRGGGQLDER